MNNLDQNREQRHQQYNKMRSWFDYAMGVIIIIGGLMIFFYKYFFKDFEFKEPLVANVFGGLCIIYGLWRIYRGYNK